MVIAVTNLKGGVGKTTIATNIAVCLAHEGYDVCIVDTDLGQQSSMEWSGNRSPDLKPIPVFGINVKQLNKEVDDLKKRYDIVVIDGTPHLSELADRTILASNVLLIPLTPSVYDFRGFEGFMQRFEQIKTIKDANGSNTDAYVIINRVVPNTNVSKDISEAVEAYNIKMLKTRLVSRISYVDTASEGRGVVEYKDKKAKEEMEQLITEILELIKSSGFSLSKKTA
jgi:chromosome partitioning protein